MLWNWGSSLILLLLLVFLVAYPVGILIYGSFQTEPPRSLSLSVDLTLRNYVDVYTHPKFLQILGNTLSAAVLGTVGAMALGAWLAWLVARTNVPLKRLIDIAGMMPLFISTIVGAVAWANLAGPRVGLLNVLLKSIGLPPFINIYSIVGIATVYILYYAPYAYLYISAALNAMEASLEEASVMCGASRWATARRVTLPLVLPAVLSSAILIFVLTMEVFAVPATLGSPARLEFFSPFMYKFLAFSPPMVTQASSLGVLLVVITVTLVSIQNVILGRRNFTTVAGKSTRPRLVELGPWRWPCAATGLLYILMAVVLPYAALLVAAFRDNLFIPNVKALLATKFLTLEHFKFIFSYPMAVRAVTNTFLVGVGAALVGGMLYFAVAYAVQRTSLPGRRLMEYLSMIPMGVPGLVVGLAFLWAWIALPAGLYGTVWILMLAYVARFMPQGVRAISNSLVQIHPELEESSRVHGAGPLETIRRITAPLVRQGIFAAMTLLFLLSVREISTSIFLYSPKSVVLSVALYDLWESGHQGPVAALSLVQSAVLILVVVLGRKGLRADLSV